MTEPRSSKTLFTPIVEPEKLHPRFELLRTSPGYEPARWMLDRVYQPFDDPEGNFLEQFQTRGFDARIFELYLFSYFHYSGFTVERTMPNPDFIVSQAGVRVAVEAITVNPSTTGALARDGKKISRLTQEELRDYQNEELPMRFGSPLFSKLQKKYWELEHCRDLPFVLAIEAFHDEESLALSEAALIRYLFGIEQTGSWAQGGRLQVHVSTVEEHAVKRKTIPSNFFGQPGAEHVSAVLFTNSGTITKFARMGYQYGIGCETVHMSRGGFCFNPQPDAMDSTFFSYNLDEPPFVEPWGQGLLLMHNPNCLHPVPREAFAELVEGYTQDGLFKSDHPSWHPFSSKTLICHLGGVKKKLNEVAPSRARIAVVAITKQEFQTACGFAVPDMNPIGEEHGWFSDETGSFLGVLVRDKFDDDWGFVVLGRDEYFHFRAIDVDVSFKTRDEARMQLQFKVGGYLDSPKRVFAQT